MPVRFPPVEDILLAKAPLREVICQVKFPLILRIMEEKPVEFQEMVRARFPVLEVERPLQIAPEKAMAGTSIDLRPPVYRFHTSERKRTASLAPDFYALSNSEYAHWVDFAEDLSYVTDAVRRVYEIPYATRVGLRYVNFIDGRFVDSGRLEDVYQLLRPELTAMLRVGVISSPALAIAEMRIPEGEVEGISEWFTFRYGIPRKEEPSGSGFVLDFDRYGEGQIDLNLVLPRCDLYHEEIYRAFRWCILEEGLAAFRPVSREA